MSILTIYHGSDHIVEKPAFGQGRKDNDYGQGFYCTEHMDMAREWAVDAHRDGYVNTYQMEVDGLQIVRLNTADYCILHWITILLKNRQFELETPLAREAYRYLCSHFDLDLDETDLIIGYRADDSFFSYASDFIDGIISVSQLSTAMHLGELGEQVFVRSEKAFDRLHFTGYEPVSAADWFMKKKERDNRARSAYRNLNKKAYIPGDLYMIRIIDEEVKADDPRLQ